MQAATPFTLSISRYKEIQEAKKTVVYYILDIRKKEAENWKLEKRFSEFVDLHNTLKKSYSNLPHFPAKTFFPLKSGPELEKRRQELEHYLQIIVTRTDIMSSEALKRFLELDNYAPEETATPPKLIAEVPGLNLGVRDFYYEANEGIFFAGLSEMSVASRVDSYLANIKMPWDHKENKEESARMVGAAECYIVTGAPQDLKFERVWTKSFSTQVINIYWDQASCLLVIGKDDGSVTILKVSSELKYAKYDEVVTNRVHNARVMGVYMDSISEFVYSIGEDSKLKIYDLKKNELCEDITCGNVPLTAIVPDKENKRIFISNRSGQVFLYDISSTTPKQIHTIQAHNKGSIRGLCFDSYKNYLLTSNYDEGLISVIDMQKPDRVKYAQTITHLRGKKKIRCIIWSSSKGEIYTGGEDGSLTFWDIRKTLPIYVMKPHNSGITKLQYLNNNNTLITGGKDSRIRFYKLPEEWIDKKPENDFSKEKVNKFGSMIHNSNKNFLPNASKSVLETKKYPGVLDDSVEDPEGWVK